MHRTTKLLLGTLLLGSSIGGAVWSLKAFRKEQDASPMKTETPVKRNIVSKRVISGHLVPHKEVELKAQIAGVLDKLYVAVGDPVTPGTSIAHIKTVPKSNEIEGAKKALKITQLVLEEAATKYQRSKQLFDRNMLSSEQHEQQYKAWKVAQEEVAYAQKQLDFILKGRIKGAHGTSNRVRSTIGGIVSELPHKEGSTVMERSTFNEGSTIATIADMSTVLFQGKVGELDVGYLKPGMQFDISLNALQGKRFSTTLTKVAPKALQSDKDLSIKFEIEGVVDLKAQDLATIRAGYTAMADIVLEQAIDVLTIKEKWLHTEDEASADTVQQETEDQDGPTTFVWVYENGQRVKKQLKLGISDGIYTEVQEGLTINDHIITEE